MEKSEQEIKSQIVHWLTDVLKNDDIGNSSFNQLVDNEYDNYVMKREYEKHIAGLEKRLENAIMPKFKTYQPVFYITKYYTSTKCKAEYDIIADKYYVAENENEIILGWNYAKGFNQRRYFYVRKDWVFATKEEAEQKLAEMKKG